MDLREQRFSIWLFERQLQLKKALPVKRPARIPIIWIKRVQQLYRKGKLILWHTPRSRQIKGACHER